MYLSNEIRYDPVVEFGKLDKVDHVDWTLPEEDQVSRRFLARIKNRDSTPSLQVLFGAPAWGSRAWVGKIYPPSVKAADYLFWYAKYFSTIELNTTHYRIPNADQVKRWCDQVDSDFVFCPKVHQGISHERFGLSDRARHVTWFQFIEQLKRRDAAGASFLQLPPYFDYSMKAELFNFLKNWPDDFELALEFRHPSWFQDWGRGRTILQPLVEYLQSRGIGLVMTDVAGRRDVLHSSLSAPFSVVRFIGNELHPSDSPRAKAWSQRFLQWQEQGLSKVYLFIHQPEDRLTYEMTEIFLEHLESSWPVRKQPKGMQLPRNGSISGQLSLSEGSS